ncbi:hypothetical protein C8J56DRAFT_890151 [Mycena floridula]|nr:hypothetical protein C8J56DRAFT_890151 [Mycena floridula]
MGQCHVLMRWCATWASAYNFSNDYSNNYQRPYDNHPNYGLSVNTNPAQGHRLGTSPPDFSSMLSMDPSSIDYCQLSSPSPAQKVRAVQPPPTVPSQTGQSVIPLAALTKRMESQQRTSDDKIKKLSSKAVKGAALKVPEVKDKEDKEKAVIFNQIANVILDGTVTWKQVKLYWLNHAWAKYKACRELVKHTGGGDGDQDKHNPGSDAEDKNGNEEETKKL